MRMTHAERIRHWRKCPCERCQTFADELEREEKERLDELAQGTVREIRKLAECDQPVDQTSY